MTIKIMIRKIASLLMSKLPESHLKNHFRCWLYNLKQNYFKIYFRESLFYVHLNDFELIFEKNPFHLLIEQHQYNRYYSLKKGDIVIDAGGFWGTYTLYASKVVGESGRVFVFEPDPINREQLTRHLELNDSTNITLIDKGLWDQEESLPFSSSGDLGASFVGTNEDCEYIDVTSIDVIMNEFNLSKINFIKMDIEGAEIEAVQGAEKALKIGSNLAIASYHIVNGEPTSNAIEVALKKMNYEVKTEVNPEMITFARPNVKT